jgi:hypothetical protein
LAGSPVLAQTHTQAERSGTPDRPGCQSAGSHAGPIPCGCGQIPRSCQEPVAAGRTGHSKPE